MGFDKNDPILETGHDISRGFAKLNSKRVLIAGFVACGVVLALVVWAFVR